MKSTIFFLFSVKNIRTKDSSADKSCGWQTLPLSPTAFWASRFLFAFIVILELEKELEKFHSESHRLRDKPAGAKKG